MSPIRTVTAVATARMFIGLEVPKQVHNTLLRAIQAYPQYVERVVPQQHWHITLIFLGEVENPKQYTSRLRKPLPQAFLPTVSITHVGRGLVRKQLWAYCAPTPVIQRTRESLLERLYSMRFPLPQSHRKDFVPHIHVATFFDMTRRLGIPDHPAVATFAIPQAYLYRSIDTADGVQYSKELEIPLT